MCVEKEQLLIIMLVKRRSTKEISSQGVMEPGAVINIDEIYDILKKKLCKIVIITADKIISCGNKPPNFWNDFLVISVGDAT